MSILGGFFCRQYGGNFGPKIFRKNTWAYQRYQRFLLSIIGLFMDYIAVIIKALKASRA